MKDQSDDIGPMIAEATELLRSMRRTIDAQHEEICKLNRNVQKLNNDLRKKDKLIKELSDRLSKYEKPDKNSGNSSTPPSKEGMSDEIVRRTKSLRKPSGRKTGGQPGHEGRRKDMTATPDVTEDHASRYCRQCGRSLDDVKGRLVYATQEIDLPASIVPVVTEHRHYEKVCQCGCHNHGYAPRRRGGSPVTYGKTVQALVTYLNIVQCVPYERLQTIMREVFSVPMSQGTIKNLIDGAMRKAAPAIKVLEDMLKRSPVVGFDESGCYNQKRLDWAWIAQTAYVTLCFRASGRAIPDINEDAEIS